MHRVEVPVGGARGEKIFLINRKGWQPPKRVKAALHWVAGGGGGRGSLGGAYGYAGMQQAWGWARKSVDACHGFLIILAFENITV